MPRSMSAGMLAAFQANQLNPAIFIQAQFKTGIVYLWSGLGTISWNSQSWIGIGSLISVSVVEEGATTDAKGISISLSGVNNSLLADALQEFQVGSPVVVYLGLFGGTPLALLTDPVISWAGQLDQPIIDVGADTAIITINAESRMILHNVSVVRRYTQDDQVIDFPGDTGFQFVNSIVNQNLYWGRTPTPGTGGPN